MKIPYLSITIAVVAALVAYRPHYVLPTSLLCPKLDAVRGSVVVLTGASQGIGEELALQYAALGARLVLASRRRPQLEAVATKAREAGAADVIVVPADMTSAEDCVAVIDAAVAAYGRIDLLMLNHATADDRLFEEYETVADLAAGLRLTVDANYLGSVLLVKAALPYLRASRGHIAVISSASLHTPVPFHGGYQASKRALNGYFETLRHEFRLTGVPVTIGVQELGMIGTPAIMKHKGNHFLAVTVPDTAANMICVAAARWDYVYVPYWYGALQALFTSMGSTLLEAAMNHFYIFNSEDFVARIQQQASRLDSGGTEAR